MRRPPRNRYSDKLMSGTLISVADGQKGTLECLAGYFVYFVIMAESGFLPSVNIITILLLVLHQWPVL